MSEQVKILLVDATFEQLKTHATNVMGLEVHPAATKPEKLIAAIKAADDKLEHIMVDAPAAEPAATTPAKTADKAPTAKAAAKSKDTKDKWIVAKSTDGMALDFEINTTTGMTRPIEMDIDTPADVDDGDELLWVQLSTASGKGGKRPYPVSVNGNTILIPRGTKVPVKKMFMNVLANAVEKTYNYDDDSNDIQSQEDLLIPFSVFGTVEEMGDDFGGEEGRKALAIIRGQNKK